MLLTGIFGVILSQSINLTPPRLGSMMMIVLIIIMLLTIGVIADHFGWLAVPTCPVDLTRILGILTLVLGGYLIAR